ncbi:MAG: serine/threonine protein phosphatase [Lachnospiraceae bacterium]|nr:serine/threonine protein phosphatase [Lachnospiraceae bacterium]
MSTYVISDIHGNYEAYMRLLEKIRFSESDTLYVLGDILDRGPEPIRIVLDLMARPNVICIAGNHELMAMDCLQFLTKEVTEENIRVFDKERIEKLLTWQMNGSEPTIDAFSKLSAQTQRAVLDFLSDFELFDEVFTDDAEYILVHAGLGNFRPDKELWDYHIDELVWERPDYNVPYFPDRPDRFVITGHTPTMAIPGNPRPGYIFRNCGHIAIDCGAGFGGRLACICLETQEEFYEECGE